MLLLRPIAPANEMIVRCFQHGKIFTFVKGRAVDSVTVPMLFQQIETIRDVNQRIAEKEKVIDLIKNKNCE